jgi:hypothetical protein
VLWILTISRVLAVFSKALLSSIDFIIKKLLPKFLEFLKWLLSFSFPDGSHYCLSQTCVTFQFLAYPSAAQPIFLKSLNWLHLSPFPQIPPFSFGRSHHTLKAGRIFLWHFYTSMTAIRGGLKIAQQSTGVTCCSLWTDLQAMCFCRKNLHHRIVSLGVNPGSDFTIYDDRWLLGFSEPQLPHL